MNTPIDTQSFIRQVARLAVQRLDPEEQAKTACMLTYGLGRPNLRGVTVYEAWQKAEDKIPFVEICAAGQQNSIQLAGTTIHELGHVLAGHAAGHGKEWKHACKRLGLRRIKAAGTTYLMAHFESDIRSHVYRLIQQLEKAEPTWAALNNQPVGVATGAPCPAGIGGRGGTSRGPGSGSRMLKFECHDCDAIWRMSRKYLESVTACPCCQGDNIQLPEV